MQDLPNAEAKDGCEDDAILDFQIN